MNTFTKEEVVSGANLRVAIYPPQDVDTFLPADQWRIYELALEAARARKIPFAVGGGTAVSFYTGLWRNSKDIDLYILPKHRQPMIDAVLAAGFEDYYPQKSYDRSWIFRATKGDVIVDLIWAMANGAGDVQHSWLESGEVVTVRGQTVQLVAPEEILWSKIHVVQRERCDWPDLLNLLYVAGPSLNWRHIFARLKGEEKLLTALLELFAWSAPGRAARLPNWVWQELSVPAPTEVEPLRKDEHIKRLDSRAWFTEVTP